MNKEDQFWYILMKAVSGESGSNRKFYFDPLNNCIFSLIFEDSGIRVHYRNSHITTSPELEEYFKTVIPKFNEDLPTEFIEIPRISFSEKRSFLKKFVQNVKDSSLQAVLFEDLKNYPEQDTLDFKVDLKRLDSKLFFQFDMERGKFLSSQAMNLVSPLGITDQTEIMW